MTVATSEHVKSKEREKQDEEEDIQVVVSLHSNGRSWLLQQRRYYKLWHVFIIAEVGGGWGEII